MKILVLSFLVLISGLSFSGDEPDWRFTVSKNLKLCEGCSVPESDHFYSVEGEAAVNEKGNALRLLSTRDDLDHGIHMIDIVTDSKDLFSRMEGFSSVRFFVKMADTFLHLNLGNERHKERGLILDKNGEGFVAYDKFVYVSIDGGALQQLSNL